MQEGFEGRPQDYRGIEENFSTTCYPSRGKFALYFTESEGRTDEKKKHNE